MTLNGYDFKGIEGWSKDGKDADGNDRMARSSVTDSAWTTLEDALDAADKAEWPDFAEGWLVKVTPHAGRWHVIAVNPRFNDSENLS